MSSQWANSIAMHAFPAKSGQADLFWQGKRYFLFKYNCEALNVQAKRGAWRSLVMVQITVSFKRCFMSREGTLWRQSHGAYLWHLQADYAVSKKAQLQSRKFVEHTTRCASAASCSTHSQCIHIDGTHGKDWWDLIRQFLWQRMYVTDRKRMNNLNYIQLLMT